VVTGAEKVNFTVRNPSIVAWDEDASAANANSLEKVQFEYRLHGCARPTCWRASANAPTTIFKRRVRDVDKSIREIQGEWTAPAEDNRYDIRVITQCKGSNAEYNQGQTTFITGTVDRNPPKLVMLSSSSQAKSVGHQDTVTAVFNEQIVCDALEVEILLGGKKTLTIAGKGVATACHDNVLTISRIDAGTDVDVAAHVLIKNVKDEVGNVYSMTGSGQALIDAESTKKIDALEATVVQNNAKLEATVVQNNAKQVARESEIKKLIAELIAK